MICAPLNTDKNCDKASSPYTCSRCLNGWFINENKRCVPECDDVNYCESCSAPNFCSRCQSNYYLKFMNDGENNKLEC